MSARSEAGLRVPENGGSRKSGMLEESEVNLAIRDGELLYWPHFLPSLEAKAFFEGLRSGLDWQQEFIVIAGRRVCVPRQVCWYGEQSATYRYSGVTHCPLPWTPVLAEIRQLVEAHCGLTFNSVLGNFYRNGQDSMGWHADREKSLGQNPAIASLSLGASRLFKLRHNRSKELIELELGDGSLLLMAGSLQHHWRHSLPKTSKVAVPRINLTFRNVIAPDP